MKSLRIHRNPHFPQRAGTIVLATLAMLASCAKTPPQALGTLEYDRITLPAPVAERIVAVNVREGEQVAAGQAPFLRQKLQQGVVGAAVDRRGGDGCP